MIQSQSVDTQVDQKTILIVDDDEITLRLLRDIVTRLGYAVLLAENGMEALEIVVEMPPDLIILDLMLPGMNGMELLKRLRSHEDTASIPIIMVTASSEQRQMIESWNLGADDYIFKPFQLNVLEARINAILARSSVLRAAPDDSNIEMGIYRWQAFLSEVEREKLRTRKRNATTYLACIQLYELDRLLELLGDSIMGTLAKQIQAQILLYQQNLEILSVDDEHRFYLLMPETTYKAAKSRLEKLIRQLARFDFIIKNERARFTPVVGFSRLNKQLKVQQ
ncbi:response regulator, partial [Candidatus Saccharibacteria bacterium]|nr:response regulator [Candidatus Saccharibacteria bacterium]